PQRVTHPRPRERPLFPPDEGQDHRELPEQPSVEADQEGFDERVTAPEPMAEPGGDDPGEQAHWDSRRRPHRKDLGERVLPYGGIPITRWRRLTHTRGRYSVLAPGRSFLGRRGGACSDALDAHDRFSLEWISGHGARLPVVGPRNQAACRPLGVR